MSATMNVIHDALTAAICLTPRDVYLMSGCVGLRRRERMLVGHTLATRRNHYCTPRDGSRSAPWVRLAGLGLADHGDDPCYWSLTPLGIAALRLVLAADRWAP